MCAPPCQLFQRPAADAGGGDVVKIQCDWDDEASLMVTVVKYLVKLIDLWW